MKTTIQKNVLYAYLSLGGLLALVIHFIGVSKSNSANVAEGLSNSIGQLILEAYAILFFGLIVIASSIFGWWINHRKGQTRLVWFNQSGHFFKT